MNSKISQIGAAIAGALFAVIITIAFLVIGETPNTDASPEKVISFYDDSGKIYAGIFFLWFAAVLLMFFAGGFRTHLHTAGAEWLASVAFGGLILFTVGVGTFATSQFALVEAADLGKPEVAQALNILDNSNFPVVIIGISVTLLATAWHSLSTRSLPMWLAWLTLLLGIVAIIPPISWFAFLLFPIWVLIVAIFMLIGARKQDSNQSGMTPDPAQE